MFLAKDNLRLGLVLGLVGPLIGLVIVYLINVGTFSLLANALLFAIYVHFDKAQTFKGIFIITLFYGIGILVLKLFN